MYLFTYGYIPLFIIFCYLRGDNVSELKYLKDHALKLLQDCTDVEQIRLIRGLLIESHNTIVKVDDKAQITKSPVMK